MGEGNKDGPLILPCCPVNCQRLQQKTQIENRYRNYVFNKNDTCYNSKCFSLKTHFLHHVKLIYPDAHLGNSNIYDGDFY